MGDFEPGIISIRKRRRFVVTGEPSGALNHVRQEQEQEQEQEHQTGSMPIRFQSGGVEGLRIVQQSQARELPIWDQLSAKFLQGIQQDRAKRKTAILG